MTQIITNNSGGGGGGGTNPERGDIQGTLSDQTDLQNALNAKADVSEMNTKTFYLSSTSDYTTAKEIYDWVYDWANGETTGRGAIVQKGGFVYQLDGVGTNEITFSLARGRWNYSNSSSAVEIAKLSILVDSISGDVLDITDTLGTSASIGTYLRTDIDYPTPYTPQYNGSPATKKYVDDGDTVVSGDSGTTYTIKVSNSDPASGTASNIITFVL